MLPRVSVPHGCQVVIVRHCSRSAHASLWSAKAFVRNEGAAIEIGVLSHGSGTLRGMIAGLWHVAIRFSSGPCCRHGAVFLVMEDSSLVE